MPAETKVEPSEVLNRLQGVADDHEADLVEQLAIKAGYWWKCWPDGDAANCGYVNSTVDEKCGGCGAKRQRRNEPSRRG